MRHLPTACLLFCATLVAAPAHAIGVGFNFTASSGEVEDDFSLDFDNETREFGFVLDTDHGRLFQYRLNINAVAGEIEDDFASFDYGGLSINNSFGFRLAQSIGARVWAGPSFDLLFAEFDDGAEEDILGFGIGPVLGVDLRAGPTVRFSIEGGAKLRFLEVDDADDDGEVDLDGGEAFIRLSMLFGRYGHIRKPRYPRY